MEFQFQLQPQEEKILQLIARKHVVQLGEVMVEAWLSRDAALIALNELSKKDLLKTLILHPQQAPKQLLPRLQEFWARGLRGYGSFMQHRWIALTQKGYDAIQMENPFKPHSCAEENCYAEPAREQIAG